MVQKSGNSRTFKDALYAVYDSGTPHLPDLKFMLIFY